MRYSLTDRSGSVHMEVGLPRVPSTAWRGGCWWPGMAFGLRKRRTRSIKTGSTSTCCCAVLGLFVRRQPQLQGCLSDSVDKASAVPVDRSRAGRADHEPLDDQNRQSPTRRTGLPSVAAHDTVRILSDSGPTRSDSEEHHQRACQESEMTLEGRSRQTMPLSGGQAGENDEEDGHCASLRVQQLTTTRRVIHMPRISERQGQEQAHPVWSVPTPLADDRVAFGRRVSARGARDQLGSTRRRSRRRPAYRPRRRRRIELTCRRLAAAKTR